MSKSRAVFDGPAFVLLRQVWVPLKGLKKRRSMTSRYGNNSHDIDDVCDTFSRRSAEERLLRHALPVELQFDCRILDSISDVFELEGG